MSGFTWKKILSDLSASKDGYVAIERGPNGGRKLTVSHDGDTVTIPLTGEEFLQLKKDM